MRKAGRVTVIAVLVLSACGGGGSGVSAPAGKLLDTQVDVLRATAARADRATATHLLVQLRASVDQLESDGEVSKSAAARIRRAAEAVESQLARLPAPTTTTTTTTSPPPEDRQGNGEDRREHKDNGKGQGGGKD